MNLTEILKQTAQKRMLQTTTEIVTNLTIHKHRQPGSEDEGIKIDKILKQTMQKHGKNLVDKEIIKLIRNCNTNDISENIRCTIKNLKCRIQSGLEPSEIQMVLKIILRSKYKMLLKQQGSNPGTPASTDTEEEVEGIDQSENLPKFLINKEDVKESYLHHNYHFGKWSVPTQTPSTSDSEQ